MPAGFDVHVKTAGEAIKLLEGGKVTEISLDHDLGEDGGTGYFVTKWMEWAAAMGRLPHLKWAIHSANPVGRRNMEMALVNVEKFWALAKEREKA